jgi:hypothetical protein
MQLGISLHSGAANESDCSDVWVVVSYNTSVSASGLSSGNMTVTTQRATPFYGISTTNTSDFLPVSTNLTLNLPLWQSELSGATFTSIDSNALTATVTGATWGSQGRTFNGTDQRILIPDSASLRPTGNFSIEVWINPTTTGEGGVGTVVDKTAGASVGYVMRLEGAPKIRWGIYVGGVFKSATGAAGSASLGTWHHIVGVFNGANILLYTDSVLVTGDATAGPMDDSSAGSLKIGDRQQSDRCWNGLQGEFRFYNRALTATEILQNYNATKSTYLGGASTTQIRSTTAIVPNTSANWTIGGVATPYIESYKTWIGGVLKQSAAWQYGSTFTDLSGNGNTATPSFRTTSSDADVSASLVSFTPLTEAKVPTFSVLQALEPVPTAPAGMAQAFTTNTTTGIAGLRAPIDTILNTAGMPAAMWWYPFIYLAICIIGLLVYGATTMSARGGMVSVETVHQGSTLAMCITMEVFLIIVGVINIVPLWPAMLFPIAGIAIIVSEKHYSWG